MIVGSDPQRPASVEMCPSSPEKNTQETALTRGRTYVECVVGGLGLHGFRHLECLARCEFGGYRRS